ncbi:MAG: DUF3108 domain-containing protein [Acidobacteriia bacterium]|nr:DUF3108 domain-containing protein [Terriglobia bacterium]
MLRSLAGRLSRACLALSVISASHPQSKPAGNAAASSFSKEALDYSVEWRLIFAGNARLTMDPAGTPDQGLWKARLHLESGGLISKLYRIDDNYEADMDDHFCASRTTLDAMERSRHHETKVEYDRARGRASYVERDLLKNTTIKTAETEIPACVSDIIGGLYKLRTMRLEPGQSDQLILSDGKKTASARVDAQARETVKTNAGTFNTVRYEAHIFNGVLYARKAQFLMWVTDDARRLPVQFRARMSFPIGSITLQLDKEGHE